MIFKVVLNGSTVIYDGNNPTGILDPQLEIEINAAGSFTFILPSGSDIINEITPFTSEIDVYEDEEMIWFGRVLNKEKLWYNQCKITCEGGLAYFNDSIQDKKTWESTRTENQEGVVYDALVGGYFDGNGDPIPNPYLASDGDVTMAMFFRDLIDWHNGQVSENMQWEVGTIATEYAIEKIWRETNRETTSDCLQTMCLDTTGGYFITRKEYVDDPIKGRIAKRYIDWLDEMPYGSTQNIEFGVNLLDISNSINGADICTVLVPIGADELTINEVPDTGSKKSPVDGCYHVYGTDTVIYAESEAVYGRVQKTKTWSDITDKESLYLKAVEYLKEQNTDIPSIECSAAELHYLGGEYQGKSAFRVGQLVRVASDVHGIVGDYPLLKISMSLNSGAKRVTIGTPPKKELTDIVKNTSGSSSRNTSGGSSGGSGGSGGGSGYVGVKDVRLKKPGDVEYESTVKNKVSKIDLSNMVKDVKLNGVSVVTEGQALLPAYPTIPVEDVLMGGSSLVVNNKAIIPPYPTIPVTDVVLQGGSSLVVNGVASIPDFGIPSGGTAGQTLYKRRDSDYDVVWGDPIVPIGINLSETNILLTSLSDIAHVYITIDNGDGANITSSDTTVATVQIIIDDQGRPRRIDIIPVSDGVCTINIAAYGTLGPTLYDHINVTVATEALVEANPSETATDDLTTIKIGDTVYDIPGGSSISEEIASTPFINSDNIIVPRTTLTSAITEYTATENCAVFIELNAARSQSAGIWIDNVQVGGTYSEVTDVYEDTLFLKKGQTIKMQSSLSDNYGSYAVYGLEAVSPISVSYPDIYTDYEREIGVWTDGKPLYQKTILVILPSSGNVVCTLNIDIDHMADINLNGVNNNGSSSDFYNARASYVDAALYYRSSTKSVLIDSEPSWMMGDQAYLTIQYTKTTDQPGSGHWLPGGTTAISYSEDEQIIGTWTDGKPLYQKSIVHDLTLSASWQNYTNVSGFDVIDVEINKLLRDNEPIAAPFQKEGICSWIVRDNYLKMAVQGSLASEGWVLKSATIKYTKTTDDTSAPHPVVLATQEELEAIAYHYRDHCYTTLSDYYSEDERVVGRWTDGKPLYQLTFNTPALSNTSWNDFYISSLSDVETFVDSKVLVHDITSDNAPWEYTLGSGNDSDYESQLWHDSNDTTHFQLYIRRPLFNSAYATITIQYTKTTDTPGTGPTPGNLVYLPALYSEEEREVGVWTDGKPLYQKTVNCGQVPTNSSSYTSHGISDMEIGFLVSAFMADSAGTAWETVPSGEDSNFRVIVRASGNIQIITSSNWSGWGNAYVTIRYTKTTDVAGSGKYLPDGQYAHHYSANEHIVGTWIDGKTLYERTWDLGSNVSLSANNWTNTTIPNAGMSLITGVECVTSFGAFRGQIEASPNLGGGNYVQLRSDGIQSSVRYVTLRYTKTT